MTTRSATVLYTPELLGLAVELAAHPLREDLPRRGEAHSRICGSRVIVTLDADEAGRIAAIGARVTACAIGQAAAALFLRSAEGRDANEIAAALEALEAWLAGEGEPPGWPGIAQIETARPYTARHPAILLPWKAALEALSNPAPAD